MYSNQLAVAIKHNGKILRETKDLVHLPFGSEFSVLVKNLNSRRVKFTLSIDGANALDDTEIIVNANSETEIKRFIRNGNMDEGNAFKFIERTQAIEDGPRGIKVDDGVVRVEFWFEKEKQQIHVKDIYWEKHHYRDFYPQQNIWNTTYGSGPAVYGMSNISGASGSIASATSATFDANASTGQSLNSVTRGMDQQVYKKNTSIPQTGEQEVKTSAPINDVGITVPGSKVDQKFTTVYGFDAETVSHVIVLRLVGVSGDKVVTQPITVASKPTCTTCGRVNKATSRFCTDCGTSLTLL